MRDLLDAEALRSELGGLEGWQGDTSAIRRTVTVSDEQKDRLLSGLEAIAREMDHDPDLEFPDGQVTITMSTHSAGGVTELDVEYARRANDLIARISR